MWRIGLNTRLFGKVDQVSNTCYVATEFFHISYIPLIPFQSWLVFAKPQVDILVYEEWQGIPLRRSWKSILFAYLRVPLVLGGPLFALYGWCGFVVKPSPGEVSLTFVEMLAWIAFGAALIGMFAATYWLSRASSRRAQELRSILANNPPESVQQNSSISG